MNQEFSITVDRAWTPYNHLVLDFIGNDLYEKAYEKVDEKRNSWKNNVSQRCLFNIERLLRYSERNSIIEDELKPWIPKYKRYVYLDKLCHEWLELNGQNKLEEKKVELLRKHIEERNELSAELQHVLINLNEVKDLIFGEAIQEFPIKFKLTKIINRYNLFFEKRRKEYIKDLIKRTSEVKFTFEYPLRAPVYKNVKRNGDVVSVIKKVDLKSVKVENDNFFNIEIKGDVVLVKFNTFLGNLFFHNILTLNTDWFEEDFLKLTGLASALYRRFFVTRSGNKFSEVAITDLVRHFDLLKNSRYPQIIINAFEDIKNAGLIHDYKVILKGGKFSKGYIEVVKSSK
jgi:hypothetical protein